LSAGSRSAGRAVVLISGEGTNLQAFINAMAAGDLTMEIAAVIANRPAAAGLERARRAGIPAVTVPSAGRPDREAYDAALATELRRHAPDLVLLAGFMRILGSAFVREFAGRMLNVHPSLLPAYRGLGTHRRVLAAGDPAHGCTVHFVTDELDGGPAVIQGRVPVIPGDDEASLSARVQAAEHIIYPRAAGWFASGRLRLRDAAPELDGRTLHEPVIIDATD